MTLYILILSRFPRRQHFCVFFLSGGTSRSGLRMRAGQRRSLSACVSVDVAVGRCGAEELAGGSGALTQRVPSSSAVRSGLFSRGYSDSLRLRKLIHIFLFFSGSFGPFGARIGASLPARSSGLPCLGCKKGKLASGRLFWALFPRCFGCVSQTGARAAPLIQQVSVADFRTQLRDAEPQPGAPLRSSRPGKMRHFPL